MSVLDQAYLLVKDGFRRKALTEVYDCLDDLVLAGKFEALDRELAQVDLAQLEVTHMLGVLMITRQARDRLPSWPALLVRCRQASLAREGMTPERVESLFGPIE